MCALNRNTLCWVWYITHKKKSPKFKQCKGELLYRYVKDITVPSVLHTGFQNKTVNSYTIFSHPPSLQSLANYDLLHLFFLQSYREHQSYCIDTKWMSRLSMWCLEPHNSKANQIHASVQNYISFCDYIFLFLDLYSVAFLIYISWLCELRFMRGKYLEDPYMLL
jgi:hypothetical protein